jgi:glycosyltransferase involved in cell wall biosynthesis
VATRVLAVAPFHNPHVTGIYDALAGEPGLDVVRASLHALPARRVALGWPEMPSDAPYLQPWRRLSDRFALREELSGADVAILPGPFHLGRLPLDFAQRLAFGRGPILAWSEPFIAYRQRSKTNLAVLSAVARALDSPRVHLLSVGERAIEDYRSLGIRRWSAWSFGFAVAPMEIERPAESSPPSTLRIAFMGELIERKRVDLLLDALARPEIASGKWVLAVMGDGPERVRLEAQAQRLGLREKVAFEGPQDMGRARLALHSSDVLVLPSRFDGWGAAINEGLEASSTVVVSDACGSSRLIENGRSGLVFRSGDAEDLARCLVSLIADPARAAAIGRAGHDAVRAWRPAAIASRLAARCRELAGNGPAPAFAEGPLVRIP